MSFDRLFKLGLLIAGGCFLLMPGVYPFSDQASSPQKDIKIVKEPARHRFIDDFGLSDIQKKSLEENRNRSKKQIELLHKQMRDKMELIKREFEKDKFNPSVVRHINEDIKIIQARMMDERISSMLAVRNILTSEQFKKFAVKMGEMGDKFRGRKDEFKFNGMPAGDYKKERTLAPGSGPGLEAPANVTSPIPVADELVNKK